MAKHPNPEERPNPEKLLEQIIHNDKKAARGKLRIYFGAAAGVGKTYAMLHAAKEAQQQGKNILVGLVETHGRADTQALLGDFELLPRKKVSYKGHTIWEFDLNSAIERKSDLLIVDELAHSNAEGFRHPKRWQDIEELLSLGMDVWTTLNVQHLESLNSIINQITGVLIHETVPDAFFDMADEVILVDISVEELLHRLQAGKIYQENQIKRAFTHFFRKGNLISLREIALRRTADRIETEIRTYRQEKAIHSVWQTESGVLACVGPKEGDENIIRSAARMAHQLGCHWHTVFVETPDHEKLPIAQKNEALSRLKFAESLGAVTMVLHENDIAKAVVQYARKHNLSRIFFGPSSKKGRWKLWKPTLIQKMSSLASELDFIQISLKTHQSGIKASTIAPHLQLPPLPKKNRLYPYLSSFLSISLLATLAWPFSYVLDATNIALLFLLLVMLLSIRFGKRPGIFSAFFSVAIFDFFFVAPKLSLAVGDLQYILTFVVMLSVGLISSQLMVHLNYRARIAKAREKQAQTLFEFARDLSGILELDTLIQKSIHVITQEFGGKAALLLPTVDEQLMPSALSDINLSIAQWAFNHQTESGFATDTLPAHPYRYLPLRAPVRIRGVLAIAPKQPHNLLVLEKRRQLETIASLIAITLERIHFAEAAQRILLQVESEQLRNTLLSAISHDLRTPLTTLMGQAETLFTKSSQLSHQEMQYSFQAIYDCSKTVHGIVSNLLDMARIDSAHFSIRKDWQSIEEVIGSVLHTLTFSYPDIDIQIDLPADCPLVEFDPVLMARVLNNLLENAIKYSETAPEVSIEVTYDNHSLAITVYDRGIGIPYGQEEAIFEKFNRLQRETPQIGAGLGLSIAKSIVEAHLGTITVHRRATGGSAFTVSIPRQKEPTIDFDEDALFLSEDESQKIEDDSRT